MFENRNIFYIEKQNFWIPNFSLSDSQFFAPEAPIGTLGEYFIPHSEIFKILHNIVKKCQILRY